MNYDAHLKGGRFSSGEERFPIVVLSKVMPEERTRVGARFIRLAPQHHPRFFECFATFFPIAHRTRADDVLPTMCAAAMARHNMINRQVIRLHAAILASEIITTKNGTTRERHARTRATYLMG